MITVHRSRPDQAAALTELTVASKAYWGYPDELIDRWRADLTVHPAMMTDGHVYHAEVDGRLAGMHYVDVQEDGAELMALFVAPEHIRTGIGALLFRHAAGVAAAAGASFLLVESDPNAVGFYEQMGCRVIGERDSVPEGRTLPLLRIELSLS